jgi:hypothetical protein
MENEELEFNRKNKILTKNNLKILYKKLIKSKDLYNFNLDKEQLDFRKITKIDKYFIFFEENN